MEKEWLKLEGEAIEDDLQTGQVLAVLPTLPAPTPTPSPPFGGRLPSAPPSLCPVLTPLRWAQRRSAPRLSPELWEGRRKQIP